MLFFFFFSSRRRHTRCGRDWSSDVCSSDLTPSILLAKRLKRAPRHIAQEIANQISKIEGVERLEVAGGGYLNAFLDRAGRSEERRVGKECRSRWSPDH